MTALALSPALEDALQEMERRGREASEKIAKAVEVILESGDADGIDVEDPSVVRHVDELRREAGRVAGGAAVGTPPQGSVTPAVGVRVARLVRPPKKPPRDDD